MKKIAFLLASLVPAIGFAQAKVAKVLIQTASKADLEKASEVVSNEYSTESDLYRISVDAKNNTLTVESKIDSADEMVKDLNDILGDSVSVKKVDPSEMAFSTQDVWLSQ